MLRKLVKRIRGLFSLLWREIMKFGAVGGVAYIIDSGVFLLLREGALSHKTLTAGIIASVVATAFSWVANRYWTFRHRRRAAILREMFLFAVMNAIGIGISTFCLFVSHYLLEYQTTQADFIAKNVVGLVLGTIFRFLAYRYWVFTEELEQDPEFAAGEDILTGPAASHTVDARAAADAAASDPAAGAAKADRADTAKADRAGAAAHTDQSTGTGTADASTRTADNKPLTAPIRHQNGA